MIGYDGGRLRSRAGWPGALLLSLIGAGALGLVLGVVVAPPKPDAAQPNLPRGNRVPWQAGSYYLTGVTDPFYGSDGAALATRNQFRHNRPSRLKVAMGRGRQINNLAHR